MLQINTVFLVRSQTFALNDNIKEEGAAPTTATRKRNENIKEPSCNLIESIPPHARIQHSTHTRQISAAYWCVGFRCLGFQKVLKQD